MKTIFYVLIIAPFLLPFITALGMNMDKKATYTSMYAKEPITLWPSYLYDNAYPGAQHNYVLSDEFDEIMRIALTSNKTQADAENWTAVKRRAMDWIYSLEATEATLLTKSFISWGFRDLQWLAVGLTRLSQKKPGSIRTKHKCWQFTQLSASEAVRLKAIMEKGGPSNDDEEKFCADISYLSPPPQSTLLDISTQRGLEIYTMHQKHIASDDRRYTARNIIHNKHFKAEDSIFSLNSQLKLALYTAQQSLITALKEKDVLKRRNLIVSCAAFIHFEIIRIQAFAHGNQRLGRLVAHIIFAQNCLQPLCFDYRALYRNALINELTSKRSLADDVPSPTAAHFLELQEIAEETIKGYKASKVLVDIYIESCVKNALGAMILKQPTSARNGKNLHRCGWCNKAVQNKLAFCGQCGRVAYCSKDCQKKHWKCHKEICIPQTKTQKVPLDP